MSDTTITPMYNLGFMRVATVVPHNLEVGDVIGNAKKIAALIPALVKQGVKVAVFPELCLTGYTCGDLFRNETLLDNINMAVSIIADACDGKIAVFVGAPVLSKGGCALYNCAIGISQLNAEYIVFPKRHLPNYCEFYEKRWFAEYTGDQTIMFENRNFIHARNGMVTICDGYALDTQCVIGVEICEDLWVPGNPADTLSQRGANIIVNLSAGNEIVGKADYRRKLIEVTSAKNICGYIYCNAGMYESTQDMVFSGHSIIAENGSILAENSPFSMDGDVDAQITISEIDLKKLKHDRIRQDTFQHDIQLSPEYKSGFPVDTGMHRLQVNMFTQGDGELKYHLTRHISATPFVPYGTDMLVERCRMITSMQAWGLAKRMKACHCEKLVIGISGGLDSTLALLVAVDAVNKLGGNVHEQIIGITMPGMGTTDRTKNNAVDLMNALGVSVETIPIKDAVVEHLNNLGHPLDVHDVTYENAQARERTQILFDYANMHGGIVVGTGDLSELALGWCTYNGDQMSNYGVNASIPKTLVKYLVQQYVSYYSCKGKGKVATTLMDILATPISPELLPADANGQIAQKTEETVGSYDLIDFFLYNMLRCGFGPKKIYYLAKEAARQNNVTAWTDEYIKETLIKFIKRFFSMQFKRSCMPDGPKVGSVTLSPRGDWRMPSDASAAMWLKEIE